MSIEWKNGDECVYMNSKIIHVVIGRDDKYRDSFWCKSPCRNINLLDAACLSKPETQQQREDRERLENGKALYELTQKIWCDVDSTYTGHPYESPMVNDNVKEMYARLAIETNYKVKGE